jgi:hypothetical protein
MFSSLWGKVYENIFWNTHKPLPENRNKSGKQRDLWLVAYFAQEQREHETIYVEQWSKIHLQAPRKL